MKLAISRASELVAMEGKGLLVSGSLPEQLMGTVHHLVGNGHLPSVQRHNPGQLPSWVLGMGVEIESDLGTLAPSQFDRELPGSRLTWCPRRPLLEGHPETQSCPSPGSPRPQ